MKPLVDIETLYNHLDHSDWIVVDCRFDLKEVDQGRQDYEQGHIPGARFMDLNRDLSGSISKHGGRHPLPDMDQFVEKLGRMGIDQDKTVVAYDDQGGAMAARLWWMLRHLGHERVAVLDGGFQSWLDAGHPVTQVVPAPNETGFIPHIRHPERLVGMEETKAEKGWVIDSRDRDRYEGKVEPIDAKAGHIPGAVHHFWKNNLAEGQRWKSAEEIREQFSYLSKGSRPIVYCGSGVTACANLLALQLAGIEDARLYLGSWSDWISYEENPIRQGPELK